MVERGPRKAGRTVMAGFTCGSSQHMGREVGFALDTRELAAVAACTAGCYASVAHRPGCEASRGHGAGMAGFASSRGRDMNCRLAHNSCILTTVAAHTAGSYAGMIHARPQEAGCVCVACIASSRGCNMVRRLDCSVCTRAAVTTSVRAGVRTHHNACSGVV